MLLWVKKSGREDTFYVIKKTLCDQHISQTFRFNWNKNIMPVKYTHIFHSTRRISLKKTASSLPLVSPLCIFNSNQFPLSSCRVTWHKYEGEAVGGGWGGERSHAAGRGIARRLHERQTSTTRDSSSSSHWSRLPQRRTSHHITFKWRICIILK